MEIIKTGINNLNYKCGRFINDEFKIYFYLRIHFYIITLAT